MEERKNTNTRLVALVTVLVMLVLGLVGFIVYDKVINKTTEPNTGENEQVDNKEEYKNLSDEDKMNYNKEITEKLELYFQDILNNGLLENNVNLLSDVKGKLNFTWNLSFRDKKIKVNRETSETGYVGIALQDIINKYKDLFNEKITETEILDNSDFEIKNGYVYGYVITGYTRDFALKIKSHSFNVKTNEHMLVFDFITKVDENNKNDFEAYMNYIEPTILNYPQDVIDGRVKIELEQIEENYIFKSVVLEKNIDKKELGKRLTKLRTAFANVGKNGLNDAHERLTFIALLCYDDSTTIEVNEGWNVTYVNKGDFIQKYNDIFGRVYDFSKDFASAEDTLGTNDDYPQIKEESIVWPSVLGGALPSYITTMEVNEVIEKNGFYFITGLANYEDGSDKKFELTYKLINNKLYINDFKFMEQ